MFRFVRDEEQDAIIKHLTNADRILVLSATSKNSKVTRNYVALKGPATPSFSTGG